MIIMRFIHRLTKQPNVKDKNHLQDNVKQIRCI
ncbi:hypothetical protein EBL_c10150 [Shimwellia blattae DSM 4481 = NBRC 105725]|uniref:Uncharacterized protein n=1 Tax=Shimwellia blattae (strain ATCC 29907 / DSM 4481 / JCM 1650 / NBRC 105725 / CDC 9005-74) TaxID=630626 RepID=I2B6H1_SHIBC|nr:hypothetical protein EBL_c10150 [Shimwellia blattae DSM 4481 = NBRC 105725]